MNQLQKKTNDIGPAITLMILAPLLTEVLPGATRLSSMFVFPIEICVWGGGALLIRYAVRRWQLGWLNMLFLAIALALAEECIIQQTSLAPLVIRLKGVTYARSMGVNYVYLLWALIYEAVFVVFLPISLVELIFPGRRERLWISKGGMFVVIPLFLLGSFLAWFTWTRIARPKVFHLPVYNPPPATFIIALAIICGLIVAALARFRNRQERPFARTDPPFTRPDRPFASSKPPAPWILIIAGVLWATLLYGLVLLGFGIAPYFPPSIAICSGILLLAVPLLLLPRWTADLRWQRNHLFALVFGVALGSMLIGFIGFIDSGGPDLYFKIIINIIAVAGLILLGARIKKETN